MDQLKSLSVLTFFLFVLLLASHPISSFFSRADFDPKIAQDKHGSDRTMPQPPSTRFHVPAALRQGLDPTFPAPIGQSPVCRSSLVKPRYWVDGRKHESTVPAVDSGCHYSCVYSSALRRGFLEIHTCLTAQTCKGPETNL